VSPAHDIVDAVQRNGVRRLLKSSAVGTGDGVKKVGFSVSTCSCGCFLRALPVDKAAVEASNLDWTLVRPRLTDPREGRHSQDARREGVDTADNIVRADPATFVVK
jgi:hypothetical protein